MECLEESIKCKKCSQLLDKPVLLPCGNAICERHQHEERDKNNSIYCSVCDLDHEIPANGGFTRIVFLEKLIEQRIDSIEIGDEYRLASKALRDFSDLFERFEKIKNDPGDKIYSEISKLKGEIDLRREELKSQIDKDALTIIKKLDEYEVECKANIDSIKAKIEGNNNEQLKEWKEDLDRWRHQIRTFKKEVWQKINKESRSKYNEMKTAYNNLQNLVFLNRLNQYECLKLFAGNDVDMIK